ncbi:MAG TPA: hypothetical protein PLJ78_13165, partial [Anaerolineae bacterium]|nr:hypothetical protein [Anaerolineae bacterium]
MSERTITIQGNARGTVLITGDGNRVTLGHEPGVAFRLLDETFRQQQEHRALADFYNGTRPNWANIAHADDAPRDLLDRLLDFVCAAQPEQRAAVLTGLSGEGKTTLLMRLAWKASQAGFLVLWRHYGTVEAPYEKPFQGTRRVLIFMDDLPYVDELPRLMSDLNESGLPFVLLGTARTHEWANSPLRTETARLAAWQEFTLERLTPKEAQRLLQTLEERKALGTLADKSPSARLDYLLDRLQADGQLLPALLTACKGKGFDAILEDFFSRMEGRWGAEKTDFLLRGYAGIALVHRFGFWTSRPLLARFLDVAEPALAPRLIAPLRGELTDITEAEQRRLYTRHPWIAERALGLLCGHRLPEEIDLYADLFHALSVLLAETSRPEERKLLTKLPLAFKYRGDWATARRLFPLASAADPKHAPVWQAWALLEKEQGEIAKARELFARASAADPKHAPVWQAWALLEKEQGEIAKARELFARASAADPKHAPVWQAWALLEKEQGEIAKARE